ncbi:NACHT, LRR and PYD domains-containing protein 12-like [Rhinoderma darwinii]|uniref:NACHT, LRR and PYD domains-containing protein 12-like n=1 Tax=Rhinoderma darwinii TaxID=43563 RepID=UPI003F665470
MEEFRGKVVTDDDVRKFQKELSEYETHELRILYEYFKDDLAHIVKILGKRITRELSSQNIVTSVVENFDTMEKELGASIASELLVQDIFDMGREAVVGFWESLFVLQADYPHPNLLSVLSEIGQKGHTSVALILLDQEGHVLREELTVIQNKHKQHLLEKTQRLEEYRVPGLNSRPKSYNITERYLDPAIITSNKFRKHMRHEIIETGGKHEYFLGKTQDRMEHISPNKLFRWCHRLGCTPHTVLMTGTPGVGKTTLMQKFVYDWVIGKHYQRFSFVFFFKFRELNRLDKVSLETMILHQYPDLEEQLDDILQDPEKLLFIFDGLDEYNGPIDFRSKHLCSHIKWMENIGMIVASLVRQSLLKGCSVLMTSRPTKLASIDTGVFQRVSEIMGFFPKQRRMYFDLFFENQRFSETAFNYVKQNDTLYTFCYLPSYCWIICTVLSNSFQPTSNDQQVSLLPKTVTQLFAIFMANILSNHSRHKENASDVLTSIGRLAEYGVINQILVFENRDLKSFSVDPSSNLPTSFMIESVQGQNVSFSFLHLIVQEFLSALVHFINYSKERLWKSLNAAISFEDGRYDMVLRFLCGLSDPSTRSVLKSHFQELSSQASIDVIQWLHKHNRKVNISEAQSSGEQEELMSDKNMRLNMFLNLFETRNKAVVLETLRSYKVCDFFEFHLTPVDCTVLGFILGSCGEIDLLDVEICFIHGEGLERLSSTLHNIQELRLGNNNLTDKDINILCAILCNPACRIQKLSLRNNAFRDLSCEVLACAIRKNNTLEELDLSGNHVAGTKFSDLVTTLSSPTCRVKSLLLREVKLTNEYAPLLVLLSNNPNLTHLDLSNNYFMDSSASHIQDLILQSTNLKEIRIDVNEFSKKTAETIKRLEDVKPGLSIKT